MTDLEMLNHFLGIVICQNRKSIGASQAQYDFNYLTKFNMIDYNHVSIPM